MPIKTKKFMLRVTDIADRIEDYRNVLMKKIETFAVREVGSDTEKPHYHSVHLSQRQTLRDRLLKLGWTGNENHAFTSFRSDEDEDYVGVMRYVCKGEARGKLPDIVINTIGISQEQIEQYHYDWYDVENKKTKNDQNINPNDETKRDTILRKLYDVIIKRYKPEEYYNFSLVDIGAKVHLLYRELWQTAPHRTQGRAIAEGLWTWLSPKPGEKMRYGWKTEEQKARAVAASWFCGSYDPDWNSGVKNSVEY